MSLTTNQIGIDVGQKVFYADSEGNFEENPDLSAGVSKSSHKNR